MCYPFPVDIEPAIAASGPSPSPSNQRPGERNLFFLVHRNPTPRPEHETAKNRYCAVVHTGPGSPSVEILPTRKSVVGATVCAQIRCIAFTPAPDLGCPHEITVSHSFLRGKQKGGTAARACHLFFCAPLWPPVPHSKVAVQIALGFRDTTTNKGRARACTSKNRSTISRRSQICSL